MNTDKFKGIFPALMTAFTDDTMNLDRRKISAHTSRLRESGVHGFYVGGSSGEMVLCSNRERMELLETVVEAAEGLTVIAHIGAMSTGDTLALAKHAQKAGADAISSVTPLYYKYSFAEIHRYYERICAVSELPVIIYNVPLITGTTLDYDRLCSLLNIDGIGGMKFTSSDFFLLNRLKQTFPDKIFYNGSDEMLLSGLAAGADGGIGTTYNFMPRQILSIYTLFRENRIDEARAAQSLANRVIADIVRLGTLPATKQMIAYSGLDYGICREPLLPLDDKAKAELLAAWKLLRQ